VGVRENPGYTTGTSTSTRYSTVPGTVVNGKVQVPAPGTSTVLEYALYMVPQ
jgi:hypothetical protein